LRETFIQKTKEDDAVFIDRMNGHELNEDEFVAKCDGMSAINFERKVFMTTRKEVNEIKSRGKATESKSPAPHAQPQSSSEEKKLS